MSTLPTPAFDDPKHDLRIYQGDCLDLLAQIPPSSVDLVFADPPYFLSNGGITCHAGKMVSVNKGAWDKLPGPDSGHATETIIWAAKDKKSRHTFHYKLMKETNRGKQMKSVWEIKPPETWEKKFGKHPTQKPVALLERILLASTNEGDVVLDPFLGGGTTLVTALRLARHAIGCELSVDYVNLCIRRICSNLVESIFL
jgi:DNA modification methylase